MAITSAGYAGTVNDLQWSQLSRYAGLDYGVKSTADLACTQSGVTKTFNVATGEFYGRGIVDTNGAIVNIAPAVPAAGQWFLIVAHRVWATKVTTIISLAGPTTTTATPTVPPVVAPGTLASGPGTTDDQPLFWVWINSANTTTVIVDVRKLPVVQGGPIVADLNSLYALNALYLTNVGGRVMVGEGGAEFGLVVGGAWQQITPAVFASAAARDTAYAKAGGAFKVFGAQAFLTTAPGVLMECNPTTGRWQKKGLNAPSAAVQTGTGATVINDDGSVTSTFTAAGGGNVILTNAMLGIATYDTDEYDIELSLICTTATGSQVQMRMAVAGVPDISAANHDDWGVGATQAGAYTGATYMNQPYHLLSNGQVPLEFDCQINMRHAQKVQRTRSFWDATMMVTVGTSEQHVRANMTHRLTTQFDGFQILVTAPCVLTIKVKPRA